MNDYIAQADVWTILDLIVTEFKSDPLSTQCFDRRIVDRAIELNKQHASGKLHENDKVT
jgi:hypothetical protein